MERLLPAGQKGVGGVSGCECLCVHMCVGVCVCVNIQYVYMCVYFLGVDWPYADAGLC